jgi:hypothetical protein
MFRSGRSLFDGSTYPPPCRVVVTDYLAPPPTLEERGVSGLARVG